MATHDITDRIAELLDDEHDLRKSALHSGLTDEQRDRLDSIQGSLEQCWNLLQRRRRVLAPFDNPPRPAGEQRDHG